MRAWMAGAAAALLIAAGPSLAATAKKHTDEPHHTRAVSLKELDKNKDGYVSRSEAGASTEISHEFAALDANGDGKLSGKEFAKRK